MAELLKFGSIWSQIDNGEMNVLPTQPAIFDALPLADLARRWHCSTSTVRRKIRNGVLPVVQLPGSTRIFVPADAIAAAEVPRVRTPDQPAAEKSPLNS